MVVSQVIGCCPAEKPTANSRIPGLGRPSPGNNGDRQPPERLDPNHGDVGEKSQSINSPANVSTKPTSAGLALGFWANILPSGSSTLILKGNSAGFWPLAELATSSP